MTFRTWLPATYHDLATQYRMALATVITTWERYNDGSAEAARIGILCLHDVPVPALPKYPGEVSEEDKEWFHAQVKPDYVTMLRDAEQQIKKG